MITVEKLETGRMENGSVVIVNTEWVVMIGGEIWSKHDTEAEANMEREYKDNPTDW